jgi:hypothetical protein
MHLYLRKSLTKWQWGVTHGYCPAALQAASTEGGHFCPPIGTLVTATEASYSELRPQSAMPFFKNRKSAKLQRSPLYCYYSLLVVPLRRIDAIVT